jgi:hypothetical protein
MAAINVAAVRAKMSSPVEELVIERTRAALGVPVGSSTTAVLF